MAPRRSNKAGKASFGRPNDTLLRFRNSFSVTPQTQYFLHVGSDYLFFSHPNATRDYASFKVRKVVLTYYPSQSADVGGLYAGLLADTEEINIAVDFWKISRHRGCTIAPVAQKSVYHWQPSEPEEMNYFLFDNKHTLFSFALGANATFDRDGKTGVGYVGGVITMDVEVAVSGLAKLIQQPTPIPAPVCSAPGGGSADPDDEGSGFVKLAIHE